MRCTKGPLRRWGEQSSLHHSQGFSFYFLKTGMFARRFHILRHLLSRFERRAKKGVSVETKQGKNPEMERKQQDDVTSVLLREERLFKPRKEVADIAYVKDWEAELAVGNDIEAYWTDKAQQFEWFAPWTQTLDTSEAPFYKWFVGGKTNIAYNAVDRHIRTGRRYKLALLYVNERGDERKVTYYELYREVNKAANALKKLGVKKGDRVALYLPPCVESVVSLSLIHISEPTRRTPISY